jgi:hypothetical protein
LPDPDPQPQETTVIRTIASILAATTGSILLRAHLVAPLTVVAITLVTIFVLALLARARPRDSLVDDLDGPAPSQ